MVAEPSSEIDLTPEHRARVLDIIRRRLPNAYIWVYGSRAKGRARRYSDLDLILDDHGSPIPSPLMADLDEGFDESNLPIVVVLHDMAVTDEGFLDRVRKDFLPLD